MPPGGGMDMESEGNGGDFGVPFNVFTSGGPFGFATMNGSDGRSTHSAFSGDNDPFQNIFHQFFANMGGGGRMPRSSGAKGAAGGPGSPGGPGGPGGPANPGPAQHFYPYALLSSAPGVYSQNTAPFLDNDGLSFTFSPGAPLNGQAPYTVNGEVLTSQSVHIVTSVTTAMLTEATYLTAPLPGFQQQSLQLLS